MADGSSAATWHNKREEAFNLEVHTLLDDAADAIDGPGPAACIDATLRIVERLHERLIAERAAVRGDERDDVQGLIASQAWARNGELRRLDAKLTTATQALIHTRRHMVDEDDDAHAPLHLIEDALIGVGEKLGALRKAIDPEGEPAIEATEAT
jgi:hypothetical protein